MSIKHMSFRQWGSIVSLLLVAVLVIVAWQDLQHAWRLLWQVELWILALIVPAQFMSYFANGAIYVGFLKSKGDLSSTKWYETPRFALEFNFVNHILPTGGLSGLSYATWRFKKLGVSASRTALTNVLRAEAVFLVFLLFLIVSVYWLALGGDMNNLMLVVASSLSTLIATGVVIAAYTLHRRNRSLAAGLQLGKAVNWFGRKALRRKQLVAPSAIEDFSLELHKDYRQLLREPRKLRRAFAWAVVFITMEVTMFMVVFASLGYFISPAAVLLAYGVAGVAGVLAATPGGAGAHEAVMVAMLAIAGVPGSIAITAVVLARVIQITMALVTGYVFYQLTLMQYGKKQPPIRSRI